MAMTLKPKPNHPNGSVQKSQDRKRHIKFDEMWRFCSLFSSVEMAWGIMNFCHKIIRSIRNTTLKLCADYIHTYIIGQYSPSVRIIDLVSHTTYIVCVNFLYISGGAYSLKSTPNDRFFEKLFMAIFYLFSEFLPEICWQEIAEEILFVFHFDV